MKAINTNYFSKGVMRSSANQTNNLFLALAIMVLAWVLQNKDFNNMEVIVHPQVIEITD